jgi:hypothetical protein
MNNLDIYYFSQKKTPKIHRKKEKEIQLSLSESTYDASVPENCNPRKAANVLTWKLDLVKLTFLSLQNTQYQVPKPFFPLLL